MPAMKVSHIIEWNARRGGFPATSDAIYKAEDLKREWESTLKSTTVTHDYVPIRLVTLLEVFVRSTIREIVEAGTPYVERAENLLRGAKLDHLFAINLYGKKISIGDIAAHSISVNNVSDIVSCFVALIPEYKQLLPKVHDRWRVEIEGKASEPIISDVDQMFARLARLFEVRHIVTHELPETEPYELNELDDYFSAVIEFMSATDWLVLEELRGKVPLTQTEMNIDAENDLYLAQKELGTVLQAVKAKDDVAVDLLEKSQRSWESFAEKESEFHASLVEGGSMYPMIYAIWKKSLVEDRIKALQWWLNRTEGEL